VLDGCAELVDAFLLDEALALGVVLGGTFELVPDCGHCEFGCVTVAVTVSPGSVTVGPSAVTMTVVPGNVIVGPFAVTVTVEPGKVKVVALVIVDGTHGGIVVFVKVEVRVFVSVTGTREMDTLIFVNVLVSVFVWVNIRVLVLVSVSVSVMSFVSVRVAVSVFVKMLVFVSVVVCGSMTVWVTVLRPAAAPRASPKDRARVPRVESFISYPSLI
jgi:hypothetical protein